MIAPREALGLGVGPASEAELWQEAARGDEAAFAEVIARHGRYLQGVARALVGSAADAEDLVQETLVGALSSRFRGEASLRTWLVRILARQAALFRRSKWRQVRRLFSERAPEAQFSAALAGTEARLDLASMLEGLSPEHRQVIVLRELEGLGYEQMAETLGVPRGTVESRLHRARQQLRERYREYL